MTWEGYLRQTGSGHLEVQLTLGSWLCIKPGLCAARYMFEREVPGDKKYRAHHSRARGTLVTS